MREERGARFARMGFIIVIIIFDAVIRFMWMCSVEIHTHTHTQLFTSALHISEPMNTVAVCTAIARCWLFAVVVFVLPRNARTFIVLLLCIIWVHHSFWFMKTTKMFLLLIVVMNKAMYHRKTDDNQREREMLVHNHKHRRPKGKTPEERDLFRKTQQNLVLHVYMW